MALAASVLATGAAFRSFGAERNNDAILTKLTLRGDQKGFKKCEKRNRKENVLKSDKVTMLTLKTLIYTLMYILL